VEIGIAVVRRSKTLYRNPYWSRTLGRTAEETADRNFFEFIAPEDLQRIQQYSSMRINRYEDPTLKLDMPDHFEVNLVTNDGHRIKTEVRSHHIRYGLEPATLVLIRDVTKEKATDEVLATRNAELLELNKKLERLHRAKDAFMATMNSELRTPVLKTQGYLDLLLEGGFGPISEKVSARMKIAARSLRGFSNLLENMIQYHRLIDETFIHVPKLSVCSLGRIAEESRADFLARTKIDPNRVGLVTSKEPPWVLADPDLIKTAVFHLLQNAETHAGDGAKITISIMTPSDGEVQVSISDDGIGMSLETKRKVFEPFFKLDAASDGNGLGLAIVQAIMKAHNKEVFLTSEKDRGTTVSFWLPLAPEPGS
jgi:PAS domain S-box-containing protein